MTRYILIEIQDYGRAYQKVQNEAAIAYLSENGDFLYDAVPIGKSSYVVDDRPPTLPWMVEPVIQAA
jgi:hypothetical protein